MFYGTGSSHAFNINICSINLKINPFIKTLPEEKMLKDMITTAHNTNVSYEEYLKLPEIDDLLWKYPEYEPIMYACYQCEHIYFYQYKIQQRSCRHHWCRAMLFAPFLYTLII